MDDRGPRSLGGRLPLPTHLIRERHRLRCRLGVKLARQPGTVFLECGECPCPVSHRPVQGHDPANRQLVVGMDLENPTGHAERLPQLPLLLKLRRPFDTGPRHLDTEPGTLIVEPALESIAVGGKEAGEEIAAEMSQGIGRPPLPQRRPQVGQVRFEG